MNIISGWREYCIKCGIGKWVDESGCNFHYRYLEDGEWDVGSPEHLEVECGRCGYHWRERCRDYAE